MNLTTEQREALREIYESIMSYPCDRGLDQYHAEIVRDLLSGSKPAWEATEERKAAMNLAVDRLDGNMDREADAYADWRASKVLRATLEAGMIISECIFCGEMLTWGNEYREHMEKHQEDMQ